MPPSIIQLTRAVHGRQVDSETFRLPDHWALHFYEYSGQLDCAGTSYAIHPGSCSLVPPGCPVTFHYEGLSEHLYCHFLLPKLSNVNSLSPEFLSNDVRLPQLKNLLTDAIKLRRSSPQRACLRLWEVLLGIRDILDNADSHPRHEYIVETATQIVMQEMGHPLTIHDLARRCQLSHNQLTRIIKQQIGETPVIWLRRIRTDRAKEFLKFSDLPIKVIAAEVGYPDLQYFNKTIRQRFGQSPTSIRKFANR
ncbi:helix-turn-helix transcriptional regulator [Cerasicoccus arenae]